MNTTAIFFSPTQTSAKIAKAIQKGAACPQHRSIDLTFGAVEKTFNSDDLLVMAMPVYGGRLPTTAVERFKALKGHNTPVIAVAVYGNRAYEDALLELCDLCVGQGFTVVASAAFIGEHSFSSAQQPIAPNRPDRADLKQAEKLGQVVVARLKEGGAAEKNIPVKTPGNRPYKPAMSQAEAATDSTADCMGCGVCVTHCPTQAIRMVDQRPVTDPSNCIWCAACVKACPKGARQITSEKVQGSALRLFQNCQTRLEPEWYL
jgi:ferredoxin